MKKAKVPIFGIKKCIFLFCVLIPCNGSRIEGLIYDGVEANPGEFPWMISLQVPKAGSGHDHICGGTLISPTKGMNFPLYHKVVQFYFILVVVTAAHCVINLPNYPPGT
jgi:hypothetical protein